MFLTYLPAPSAPSLAQALGSAYDLSVPGLSFAYDYISPQHPQVKDILKMKCPDCDPAL